MNILEEMIRTVPKMQVSVNADDALSAYPAMDSGNSYITYEMVSRRRVRQTRYGKDVFVKSVVPGWNTVFTTIVSWGITSAHPVALQDRKSNMMPMM